MIEKIAFSNNRKHFLFGINSFLHFVPNKVRIFANSYHHRITMKYVQVNFTCSPNIETITDVLAAELAEIGFESFLPSESGLQAYIPQTDFSAKKIATKIRQFPFQAEITFSFEVLEDKNWNEEWEKYYFQPICIGDACVIHSLFHQINNNYPHSILIQPKMSFGTGHHQTTHLMLKEILNTEMHSKSVLDMGCGTAVLAILASQRGASRVTAVDIDRWAFENARENVSLNRADNVRVLLGSSDVLGDETFDVILANITRNILLDEIPTYSTHLNHKGLLIMSGFYSADIPAIQSRCEAHGLSFVRLSEMDDWVAVVFRKGAI